MTTLTIFPIRAFRDNYIWALHDVTQHALWVVDPGTAEPVIEILRKQHLKLSGIFVTHHHTDHSGGIADLLQFAGDIPVWGSHQSYLNNITDRVKKNDQIIHGPIRFSVYEIPGHTLDHIAFYGMNTLFCGDTLFSGGCGRVFEGTYQQMVASLNVLQSLPDRTLMYCGHEYTIDNLRFAQEVLPQNEAITSKLAALQNSPCTLPSLLGDEKKFNPFLRYEAPEIIAAVQNHQGKCSDDPVQIFQWLREWKNNFKSE